MQYGGGSEKEDIYPIVIHCVIDDILDSTSMHSHSTICVVDHHATDGEYHLRAMKQKIFVDGKDSKYPYLLEIKTFLSSRSLLFTSGNLWYRKQKFGSSK
jgi:hypothetical protein